MKNFIILALIAIIIMIIFKYENIGLSEASEPFIECTIDMITGDLIKCENENGRVVKW